MKLQAILSGWAASVPAVSNARSTLYQADKPVARSAETARASGGVYAGKSDGGRNWSMVVTGNPIVASSGIVYREPEAIRSSLLGSRNLH